MKNTVKIKKYQNVSNITFNRKINDIDKKERDNITIINNKIMLLLIIKN